VSLTRKWTRGYTTGVFDLFHVGHLNLLKNARSRCDELVVGVSTDDLVKEIKGRLPVIAFSERLAIVSAIRYVDRVVHEETDNKVEAAKSLKCDVIFKGSDWRGTEKWNHLSAELALYGIDVCFLDYTTTVSSTLRRAKLGANADT
jgi:glycerol-3-phosphate cytidylyltransferase